LDFSGRAEEEHLASTFGGTFDFDVVAIIHPKTLETFNEKVNGYNEHAE